MLLGLGKHAVQINGVLSARYSDVYIKFSYKLNTILNMLFILEEQFFEIWRLLYIHDNLYTNLDPGARGFLVPLVAPGVADMTLN
jgi:hypothetical protein